MKTAHISTLPESYGCVLYDLERVETADAADFATSTIYKQFVIRF